MGVIYYFMDDFGNPASIHVMGENAKIAIEESRELVASIVRAKSDNIYFTNSASEANNIILKGFTGLIISTNSEHSSVKKCLERYPENSIVIDILSDGNLNYKCLEDNLKLYEEYPKLVSIIAANNEIGTVHDLYRIGNYADFDDIGLYEILGSEGVVAIEWADKLPKNFIIEYLAIHIDILNDKSRKISMAAYGIKEENLIGKIIKSS